MTLPEFTRPLLQRISLFSLAVLMISGKLFGQQIQFPSTASTPWNPNPTNSGQLFPSAPPANTSWASVGTLQPTTTGANVLPPTGVFAGQLNSSPGITYGPATVTPFNPGSPIFGTPPPGLNYGLNTPAPGLFPNSTPPALFPSSSGQSPFGFGTSAPGLGSNNSVFSDSWLNGNNWRLGSGWFNNGTTPMWDGSQSPGVIRFFQGVRFRHTWVAGDDQPGDTQTNSLEINDSDISVAFAFPRFFGSTQPLFIVPSFSSHLWEGPSNGIADLPGSAYSAFLDTGWQTDPMRTFGLETGIRLGVFSDYNTFNADSFRIMGKILGRVRLTPTSVGRIGAYWLDRDRIKLLPAGGLTWTPNPDTRFDLFFPEPKLAHYLATVGRTDMWWYTTGYLGGGAWTITRANGAEDSVDIYDLRIMGGLEFGRNDLLRAGQRNAFIEAGYAFNRELIYRIRPQDNRDIEDSFIIRAGFGY